MLFKLTRSSFIQNNPSGTHILYNTLYAQKNNRTLSDSNDSIFNENNENYLSFTFPKSQTEIKHNHKKYPLSYTFNHFFFSNHLCAFVSSW